MSTQKVVDLPTFFKKATLVKLKNRREYLDESRVRFIISQIILGFTGFCFLFWAYTIMVSRYGQ